MSYAFFHGLAIAYAPAVNEVVSLVCDYLRMRLRLPSRR